MPDPRELRGLVYGRITIAPEGTLVRDVVLDTGDVVDVYIDAGTKMIRITKHPRADAG